MIYQVCCFLLAVGILGLAAQVLLGLGHSSHHHSQHFGGRGALASSTRHAAGHRGISGSGRGGRAAQWLIGLLSPLTLFSISLGAGAAGLAAHAEHWSAWPAVGAAAAGGLLFALAVVRPLSGLMLRFASTPSAALEGTLGSEAEVSTPFDSSGRGIVSLNLDGQFVRVLATLDDADRAIAAAIRPGEKLIVTSIDPAANACRVARL